MSLQEDVIPQFVIWVLVDVVGIGILSLRLTHLLINASSGIDAHLSFRFACRFWLDVFLLRSQTWRVLDAGKVKCNSICPSSAYWISRCRIVGDPRQLSLLLRSHEPVLSVDVHRFSMDWDARLFVDGRILGAAVTYQRRGS